MRLAPKPDLYLVLKASANTIQDRKAEVEPDVSRRQSEAYERFAQRASRATTIDAEKPADEVASDAAWAVLRAMAKKVPA